jgi:hypothetical protein
MGLQVSGVLNCYVHLPGRKNGRADQLVIGERLSSWSKSIKIFSHMFPRFEELVRMISLAAF